MVRCIIPCLNKDMLYKILGIFALGFGILAAAIILNIVANKLRFLTWYDLLKNKETTNFVSYLWLLIIYPLLLGLVAYVLIKILNIK